MFELCSYRTSGKSLVFFNQPLFSESKILHSLKFQENEIKQSWTVVEKAIQLPLCLSWLPYLLPLGSNFIQNCMGWVCMRNSGANWQRNTDKLADEPQKDTEKVNLSFYLKSSLKTLPINLLKIFYLTQTFSTFVMYQMPRCSYKEWNLSKAK